jgi:endoglycosylceramidase
MGTKPSVSARDWFAALVGALLIAAMPAPAAALDGPLSHAGRWITDRAGRVVIVHGMNVVAKTPPYAPDAMGFGSDDAAFLAANGFDVVRLGVIYQALEPRPGVYDDRYLRRIVRTQRLLARHGIFSLIDFHDDKWGPAFGGQGFPRWATVGGSLNDAWDSFWADRPGPGGVGLQDRYAAAWRHTAARFAGARYVLGYDVVNEPQPGSLGVFCLNPVFCPLDRPLGAFYKRVLGQIRAVDRAHLVWVEPNLDYDSGGAESVPALGDPQTGFSFHDYCLTSVTSGGTQDNPVFCPLDEQMVLGNAESQTAQTGEALLLSEFGSTPVTAAIGRVADEADAHRISWTEWTYTSNGSTDFAATPSLVRNDHLPPRGSNVDAAQLEVLARPYPRAVAGTPLAWRFDSFARTFSLTYSVSRADGRGMFAPRSATEVELPALVYPGGYGVVLSGATVCAPYSQAVLRVCSVAGATTVTVRVTPGP